MYDAPPFVDEGMRGILPGVLTDTQKKTKVKRPLNAYNLFFMERQPIVKADNPELKGNEVSKELGRQWKKMTDEERRPYFERAKQIWDEFRLENPDYHYDKSRNAQKNNKGFRPLPSDEMQFGGYLVEMIASHMLAQYAIQNKDVSDAVIASITSDSLPLFLANIADPST